MKERLGIPLTAELPIDLSKVDVFVGGLLGAMLVFLFSSLAIRAVGNAAGTIIEEVRRQFRADPGIMAGTSRPDYAAAVDITAKAALREMVLPGILAVGMPVAVGLIFRYARHEEVVTTLNGITYTAHDAFGLAGRFGHAHHRYDHAGILMATVLNNGGGAWDNAKKFIESGGLKDENGNTLGKGSDPHKAAVVGDTVGDPFKDTAGPSLHVLIKLLATITLVLAPLFIKSGSVTKTGTPTTQPGTTIEQQVPGLASSQALQDTAQQAVAP